MTQYNSILNTRTTALESMYYQCGQWCEHVTVEKIDPDTGNVHKILSPSSSLLLLAKINAPCSAVSLRYLGYWLNSLAATERKYSVYIGYSQKMDYTQCIHSCHPNPNPNSYPNITLTLILTLTNPNLNSNSTLTLRRVTKVRKWTIAHFRTTVTLTLILP